MRVLFSIHPMYGHFHAMVPLAQAIQAAGHEVAFATGKRFGPALARTGFAHLPCGLDFDGSKDIFEAVPEWQAIRSRLMGNDAAKQVHGFVEGLAPLMADDLLKAAKVWKPDVIVRDPLEFGGYITAELLGIPHATAIWAFYIPAALVAPAAFHHLRQRFGLPHDASISTLDQYLIFEFMPESWAIPGMPSPRVAHRYCSPPFDQSQEGRLPEWAGRLPYSSTVYATLGTTFNQSPETFQAIIDAFREESVNLIMTVGNTMDPASFGPQPAHIRIERYICQTLILQQCAAFIFHGGYNSLLSGLWQGLPMVLIPMGGGDQFPTSQRCHQLGAGIMLDGGLPSAGRIREAVQLVLSQSSYRKAARQLQQEIRSLPPLAGAVRQLETLSRDRQPQWRND